MKAAGMITPAPLGQIEVDTLPHLARMLSQCLKQSMTPGQLWKSVCVWTTQGKERV